MTTTARAIAPTPNTPSLGRPAQIAGWVITGLISALLLVDAVSHLAMPQSVKDATYDLGFTDGDSTAMGLVLLGCIALYLFPRTSILGAVVLTGYLGGAVTALMVDETSFAAGVFFPIVTGVIVWAGLWLRDTTVRSIMPFTPPADRRSGRWA